MFYFYHVALEVKIVTIVTIGNKDVESMVVRWEIQCVIYSFYGAQIGPENYGMRCNELKYLFSSIANIDTRSPSSDKLNLI
jgi:hypothetical protein